MAMEPMDEGPHLLHRLQQAARLAWQLDAGARAKTEVADVLVEAIGSYLERQFDGGHVA